MQWNTFSLVGNRLFFVQRLVPHVKHLHLLCEHLKLEQPDKEKHWASLGPTEVTKNQYTTLNIWLFPLMVVYFAPRGRQHFPVLVIHFENWGQILFSSDIHAARRYFNGGKKLASHLTQSSHKFRSIILWLSGRGGENLFLSVHSFLSLLSFSGSLFYSY